MVALSNPRRGSGRRRSAPDATDSGVAPRRKISFRSKLHDPVSRFASELVEGALVRRIRTAKEFLDTFPASRIARALEHAPQARASILEIGMGMSRHQAELEPATVFSITLQRALQTGELDAETLVQLLRPDDRVRYLPRSALWNYVKGERLWWEKAPDGGVGERARANTALIVDLALLHGLLAPEDVAPAGVAQKLVEHLPRRRVAALLRGCLKHDPVQGSAPHQPGAPALPTLLGLVPIDLAWRIVLEPHLESIFLERAEETVPTPVSDVPAGAPVQAMECDEFVEYGENATLRRANAPAPRPRVAPRSRAR